MYPKAYIQTLVKNGPVVSEKSKFQFSHANDLSPRSRNDFDLHYSYTFINLTRTVRGSDYSPAVGLSEQKDKLVTENWRD